MTPQHFRDFRHAHGHAGVSGVGLLHGVHRKRAYRIGEFQAGAHSIDP
jgi:hypothetical protein